MSWSSPFYLSFASRAACKTALETAFGKTLPNLGDLTDGDRRFFVIAPIFEWVTKPTYAANGSLIDPGQKQSGFWVMVRLWNEWSHYQEAVDAITPRLQSRPSPDNVFFGV